MAIISPPYPTVHDFFVPPAISLGTEEIRRLINRRKRVPVLSLEEKRKLQAAAVRENLTTFTRDDKGINIFIIDLDNKNENGDFELDQIQLQSVPRKLDMDPEANFAPINPMARNNPFYHYTGGEDTLEFTLDWYSNKLDGGQLDWFRTEALRKAKWLEAKSRNNGLEEPPHRVKLVWGGDDSVILNDEVVTLPSMLNESTWIVYHAPYTMSMFHKDFGMRPTQIIQQVTLKRVTATNRTTNQIKKISS